MGTAKSDTRVRFTDGFVINKGFVLISAQVIALEDYEHSRIFAFKENQWFHEDVDAVVWSVCAVEKPKRTLFVMGREGVVYVKKGQGFEEEHLDDAGTGDNRLGYLSLIREIDAVLYACGSSGQIYRRAKHGWTHFDDGVLNRTGGASAVDLYCMDGQSSDDIYAVGKGGQIYHYDGKAWTRIASPAVVDINWVRCLSKNEVYLAANDGGFFKGSAEGGWENHSRPDLGEEFWCVEVFQGAPYLAATSGIYMFDGKMVVRVSTRLKPAPDGQRLHANDGILWSFGAHHLCFFDGKKWTYVNHPDNP